MSFHYSTFSGPTICKFLLQSGSNLSNIRIPSFLVAAGDLITDPEGSPTALVGLPESKQTQGMHRNRPSLVNFQSQLGAAQGRLFRCYYA